MPPRRTSAPGPNDAVLRRTLGTLRRIGRQLRTIEVQLALTPFDRQGPLLDRLAALVDERERVMRTWAKLAIPRTVRRGARYVEATLRAPVRNSAVLAQTIQLLQQQTFAEVAANTTYISNDTKRLLRTIAQELTELQIQGLSLMEARKAIAARMESIGLRAFRDVSGRQWRLETYSEMLARTRTAEAYAEGTFARSSEFGVNAYMVFDGDYDDHCRIANGKIVSDAWARGHRIAHPNCVRAFGPMPDYDGPLADLQLAA